eukprot:scaffold48_cov311-Pinguiococcus_pyrenoidosus.AAC.100
MHFVAHLAPARRVHRSRARSRRRRARRKRLPSPLPCQLPHFQRAAYHQCHVNMALRRHTWSLETLQGHPWTQAMPNGAEGACKAYPPGAPVG